MCARTPLLSGKVMAPGLLILLRVITQTPYLL